MQTKGLYDNTQREEEQQDWITSYSDISDHFIDYLFPHTRATEFTSFVFHTICLVSSQRKRFFFSFFLKCQTLHNVGWGAQAHKNPIIFAMSNIITAFLLLFTVSLFYHILNNLLFFQASFMTMNRWLLFFSLFVQIVFIWISTMKHRETLLEYIFSCYGILSTQIFSLSSFLYRLIAMSNKARISDVDSERKELHDWSKW